jgi:hypothetical protein
MLVCLMRLRHNIVLMSYNMLEKGESQRPYKTTNFKKKKINMEDIICYVCDNTKHFVKKYHDRKGIKKSHEW